MTENPPRPPYLSDEALAGKVRRRPFGVHPLVFVILAFGLGILVGLLLARGGSAPAPAPTPAACSPCPPPCPEAVPADEPPAEEVPAEGPTRGRGARKVPVTAVVEGTVKVRAPSALKGSKLYVDGRYSGVLPLQVKLPSGAHTFRVVGPDGSFYEVHQDLRYADAATPFLLTLEDPTGGL